MSPIDPRTPVIVGVGQVTNRRERIVDPMTLMEEAARAADADAGGRALERIGSVQVLNIVSWRYRAPATTLAQRLGLPDGERFTTTVGGSTPLWLLFEACEKITGGSLDGVLIVGAEALDSARRARSEGVPLDRGDPDAPTEDPVVGDDRSPVSDAEIAARIVAPATIYPMLEQALAARDGRTPQEQRILLGEVMAPFTKVAASNPETAWFPRELTPLEISNTSPDNRMIAEPYTKNLNAILQVDMGAAILVLSMEAAQSASVPNDRCVFPWAGAGCDGVFHAAARPDLTRSAGLTVAAREALLAIGIGVDDVSLFDFYSCFPSAVQMGAAAIGLALDDPRGLTVTGGLPFFGGPGNNYVTHAIATMVERLRDDAKAIGAVTGVSWYMSKNAIGIFSSAPASTGWRYPDTDDAQIKINATGLEVTTDGEGEAVVDAFTVEHDREQGPVRAPVYAMLADGRRTAATPADPELPKAISGRSIVGEKIRLQARGRGTVYELL